MFIVHVNALNRAMLISTELEAVEAHYKEVCQCPQSGDAHFYKENPELVDDNIFGVNALSRAILISTLMHSCMARLRIILCQCP